MSVNFTNSQVKKIMDEHGQEYDFGVKTHYKQSIKFWISYCRMLSKPRMTQSDKWNEREIVEKYFAYKDHIIMEYKRQNGVMYNQCISVSFLFKLKPDYRIRDLSNMIKAIEDSLNGVAWYDDTIRIIRSYNSAQVFFNRNIDDDEACRVIISPIISDKISPAYRDKNKKIFDDITDEEIEKFYIEEDSFNR